MRPVDDDQTRHRALLDEADSLVARGPRSRQTLTRLADRGDWRERMLAVSALGRLARHDRQVRQRFSLVSDVLARIPGVRAVVPTVGRRGALVIGTIHNAAAAPFFATRAAAALAIGECRHVRSMAVLESLLADRFVPVRRAAAVALAALGRAAPPLVAAAVRTPAEIMPGEPTSTWLAYLAARHLDLFGETRAVHGLGPHATALELSAWLSGELEVLGTGGSQAEADRYADEPDLRHQALKPFGAHDRAESLRQLDAFTTLAAHLDLPAGALVLDAGGGSGWVGELLVRYGFKTAVLDVSLPLLRLARQRLSPRAIPAVAADLVAWPIRSAVVDAIMIIDALHHVEDTEAVLREAHRTLKSGGVLLLAEPGQGHPEAPHSLAEARHHRVREGAIDPKIIGRAAARAGFATVDIVPRVPAMTRMPVAAIDAAVRSPVERWTITLDDSVTTLDALTISAMLARPMMVLRKAGTPASSGSAARLRARILPAVERRAGAVIGRVDLRNIGEGTWRVGGGTRGVANLGVQLLSPDGAMIARDFARIALPYEIPPDARCTLQVALQLPDADARYRLKLDMVIEQECWLEEVGSEPGFVDV